MSPSTIPKKPCLKAIEVNWVLSFAKIPIEADIKTAKPRIKREIIKKRNVLSTPELLDMIDFIFIIRNHSYHSSYSLIRMFISKFYKRKNYTKNRAYQADNPIPHSNF